MSVSPQGIYLLFCHNLTNFTFCAAKLQRKSELTKEKSNNLTFTYQEMKGDKEVL